jgi:hypothetical protein
MEFRFCIQHTFDERIVQMTASRIARVSLQRNVCAILNHELPVPQDLAGPPQTWREPFKVMMLELQLGQMDTLEAHELLVEFLERLQ